MNKVSVEELAAIARRPRVRSTKTSFGLAWLTAIFVAVGAIGLCSTWFIGKPQSTIHNIVSDSSLAARLKLGALLSTQTAKILDCKFYGALANDFRGTTIFVFAVQVQNLSDSPLDEAFFYIRAKNPSRSVPQAETVEFVSIPGGIEPHETKPVAIQIPTIRLGIYGNVYPPNEPIEIALVDRFPNQKPYLEFKNSSFVTAEFRQVQDPNLKTLLGL